MTAIHWRSLGRSYPHIFCSHSRTRCLGASCYTKSPLFADDASPVRPIENFEFEGDTTFLPGSTSRGRTEGRSLQGGREDQEREEDDDCCSFARRVVRSLPLARSPVFCSLRRRNLTSDKYKCLRLSLPSLLLVPDRARAELSPVAFPFASRVFL